MANRRQPNQSNPPIRKSDPLQVPKQSSKTNSRTQARSIKKPGGENKVEQIPKEGLGNLVSRSLFRLGTGLIGSGVSGLTGDPIFNQILPGIGEDIVDFMQKRLEDEEFEYFQKNVLPDFQQKVQKIIEDFEFKTTEVPITDFTQVPEQTVEEEVLPSTPSKVVTQAEKDKETKTSKKKTKTSEESLSSLRAKKVVKAKVLPDQVVMGIPIRGPDGTVTYIPETDRVSYDQAYTQALTDATAALQQTVTEFLSKLAQYNNPKINQLGNAIIGVVSQSVQSTIQAPLYGAEVLQRQADARRSAIQAEYEGPMLEEQLRSQRAKASIDEFNANVLKAFTPEEEARHRKELQNLEILLKKAAINAETAKRNYYMNQGNTKSDLHKIVPYINLAQFDTSSWPSVVKQIISKDAQLSKRFKDTVENFERSLSSVLIESLFQAAQSQNPNKKPEAVMSEVEASVDRSRIRQLSENSALVGELIGAAMINYPEIDSEAEALSFLNRQFPSLVIHSFYGGALLSRGEWSTQAAEYITGRRSVIGQETSPRDVTDQTVGPPGGETIVTQEELETSDIYRALDDALPNIDYLFGLDTEEDYEVFFNKNEIEKIKKLKNSYEFLTMNLVQREVELERQGFKVSYSPIRTRISKVMKTMGESYMTSAGIQKSSKKDLPVHISVDLNPDMIFNPADKVNKRKLLPKLKKEFRRRLMELMEVAQKLEPYAKKVEEMSE